MQEKTQDALIHARHYGRADLFVNFTMQPIVGGNGRRTFSEPNGQR